MKKFWFLVVSLLILLSACGPDGETEADSEDNDNNARELPDDNNDSNLWFLTPSAV